MRLSILFAAAALSACSPARAPNPSPDVTAPEVALSSEPVIPTPTSASSSEPPMKACTKIGCMDTMLIELLPAKLTAGAHEVTVKAAGKEATCKVTVPYPACGTPATECAGTLPMMANESGCELPKDQQKFPSLTIGELATEVSVTVKRGAAKLVTDKKAQPTVSENRPNGPDCDPVCKTGRLSVEWK